MEKLLSILIFVVTGFLFGCQQNGLNADETNNPAYVEGENFRFYTDTSMYDEAVQKRSGDPFEITRVWRTEEADKKYLHIEVKHKKDCDKPPFEIIWDGRVAESYPLQTWLLVKLDAEDCPDLNDFATDTLSLNLYKFLGDKKYLADGEVIFHVYNASSDQNVSSDPDSTTSSK